MPDNFLERMLENTELETEGYESFYDPDKTKGSNFWNSEDYSPPEGKTVTGKLMSSHAKTTITGNTFKDQIYGNDKRIFGLPFKYSQLSDPLNRVYQSTFEAEGSCIAFIKFGVPKINRLLYQKMKADNTSEDGKSTFGIGSNVVLGLASALDPDSRVQDQRLISFKEANRKFMKYASTSLTQLALLLDLPGGYDADSTWDAYDKDGFAFYCVKTGAFNEAVTNQYTVPDIIDQMNSDAAKKRQNYQMYGTYGNVETTGGSATEWLKNIATGALEKIKEDIANNPIIGSVASVFMSTNKGSMSYYGKIWADSQTENSYSLSFKFRSPYGNKYDIFRNIYLPFLLLHTAAIPKQDGRFSYQEPFMIQVDFPGWFRINCGVITNLSWVKGGDSLLFNIDGLPLEMTVTMQVEDLYPIQLASENVTALAYNYGLLSFLESMAGLTVSQVSSLDPTGSFQSYLKQNLAKTDGSISGTAGAYFKSAFQKFVDSYSYLGSRT